MSGQRRRGVTGNGRSTAPAGTAAPGPRQQRPAETVLITGASSGIGRELARLYASDGARLILVARSEDKLRQLADELAAKYGAEAQVLPADLSRPASPREIAGALAQRHIDVDILVNDAGFGARGSVAGLGVDRQLDMVEVNVAALTQLTALLLPGMLERGHGAILNVASTAAFQPDPNQAVYGATKAYVLSFTEALAEEVRGSGVRVSCLAPGPTETGHAAVPAGRDGRRARGPGRARWRAAGQDPGHSRPAQPHPGVLRAPVPARSRHQDRRLPAGIETRPQPRA